MLLLIMKHNSNSLNLLNQDLAFHKALLNLSQVAECKTVLVPYLRQKLSNQWLDPRECKSDKDFKRKYEFSFAMAQMSQELVDLLSPENLTAKIDNINKAIEREKIMGEANYSLEGEDYAKK